MVFASQAFLAFLGVVLGVYWLLGRAHPRAGKAWLILASLFFYGYWLPAYLLLLGTSVLGNYAIVRALLASGRERTRAALVSAGIVLNVGLIAYYKYFMFLAESWNLVFDTGFDVPEIVLPIGISFFTFQQIGLLVDAWRGRVSRLPFWDHVFFIAFFPQLIAGPIVSQREMLPQLAVIRRWRLAPGQVAAGATLFSLGLFKKTVLIDPFTPYIDALYDIAARGDPVSTIDAWAAGVGYGFQVYFDFSGYSDMAIGLACMFGVALPLNFFSPYKASSIRMFWRRWHVTLSRFLRDYLFIPLGGSRHGPARTIAALTVTMGLGGLWHGAGWNFVIWGLLHGAYLSVNHVWRSAVLPRLGELPAAVRASPPLQRIAHMTGVGLTFAAVSVAWVFFRAPDFASASALTSAMFGFTAQAGYTDVAKDLLGLFPLYFLVVWGLPNTMQLFRGSGAILHVEDYALMERTGRLETRFGFRLNRGWAAAAALVFVCAWFAMSNLSPFIYYQF